MVENKGKSQKEKGKSQVKIEVKELNIWFGKVLALKNLNLEIQSNEILGVIGPASSGKTSLL